MQVSSVVAVVTDACRLSVGMLTLSLVMMISVDSSRSFAGSSTFAVFSSRGGVSRTVYLLAFFPATLLAVVLLGFVVVRRLLRPRPSGPTYAPLRTSRLVQ